jgi:ribosomal protein S18 acetylase RimI-like enzyme
MQKGNLKNLTIRPARTADARFLARMILMTGRGHVKKGIWEVVLGSREEECLAFLEILAATQIPHLFHYSCYLVAEIDNKRVASLGSYDPQVMGYHALKQAMPEVLKKLGLAEDASNKAANRSERILACLPKDIIGSWVIDSVATLPAFRRKGIASKLLEKVLEQGRRRGFSRAQINLYIGNSPAQEAYEKQGFKVVEEKLDQYFEGEIGSPGMLSMVKELS